MAGIALALIYYSILEGSTRGQTIGKRVFSIKVTDLNTGHSIGYPRAALRYVASYLSTIPLALGYLWMLWDPERQTWHDKIAGSVVSPVRSNPFEIEPA
jgi:uncharacterized RDD family membrane protein YckC